MVNLDFINISYFNSSFWCHKNPKTFILIIIIFSSDYTTREHWTTTSVNKIFDNGYSSTSMKENSVTSDILQATTMTEISNISDHTAPFEGNTTTVRVTKGFENWGYGLIAAVAVLLVAVVVLGLCYRYYGCKGI